MPETVGAVVPVQGSSPQSLHLLAGLGPELPRSRLTRCPLVLLHLAVPYPHPAPSGDDCSQKPHAQPPDQYPVAKGCQSDLYPERQTKMTLAFKQPPPRERAPDPTPPRSHLTLQSVSGGVTPRPVPVSFPPLLPLHQQGIVHSQATFHQNKSHY